MCVCDFILQAAFLELAHGEFGNLWAWKSHDSACTPQKQWGNRTNRRIGYGYACFTSMLNSRDGKKINITSNPWTGSRENVQETPSNSMGKSMVSGEDTGAGKCPILISTKYLRYFISTAFHVFKMFKHGTAMEQQNPKPLRLLRSRNRFIDPSVFRHVWLSSFPWISLLSRDSSPLFSLSSQAAGGRFNHQDLMVFSHLIL